MHLHALQKCDYRTALTALFSPFIGLQYASWLKTEEGRSLSNVGTLPTTARHVHRQPPQNIEDNGHPTSRNQIPDTSMQLR